MTFWEMEQLEEVVAEFNREHRLEVELDTIREIYGEDIVETMAHQQEDVLRNMEYLVKRNFGESVSDICNRFGILLLEDPKIFEERVNGLIADMGEDYVNLLAEDMSPWGDLM